MQGFFSSVKLLPGRLSARLNGMAASAGEQVQEIHLRLGRVPTVLLPEGERALPGGETVSRADLLFVLERACQSSPYAAEESVRRGYICAPGGVRVGLCGRMRPGTQTSWAAGGLTSVNIRIPREVRGCAEGLCGSPFPSTLIISPPGGGKTTLLRDMVRLLSDGGARISLCDERGEVAAMGEDGFGFDVGEHTDVLSDLPKRQAALQLLRTMNPQILAMDEITGGEDASVCLACAGCGVKLLATAHAADLQELRAGALYASLARSGVFERVITIRQSPGGREYREDCL